MVNPTPLVTRPTGYRLMPGEWLNAIINRVNALIAGTVTGSFTGTFNGILGGTTPAAATVTDFTQNGVLTLIPQAAAAAGSTQLGATLITKSVVMVSVTASSQGVRLPTAATGRQVTICAASAKGVKVYPFLGDRIQGAATNAAVALVLNKSSIYIASDTINWRVVKGA